MPGYSLWYTNGVLMLFELDLVSDRKNALGRAHSSAKRSIPNTVIR